MTAPPEIQDYHAHVYFDADRRGPAKDLRKVIEAKFRSEERRVGKECRSLLSS